CADCVFEPPADPAGRARLAMAAARAAAQLAGEKARVRFLAGPATEDAVGAAAVTAFEALAPGIPAGLDTRLTLDGPDPRFRGRADVLIFPSSTAGHLALSAVRSLAGARVLGPLLLGVPAVVAGTLPDADDAEIAGTAALGILLAGGTKT
ncbi:MAG: phosphate acyltransferase, partial [Gemmatimonadales bacterium]